MSKKTNGVASKTPAQVSRRIAVIARLEKQLKANVKPVREVDYLVPLTEKDITRINKELTTLKSRV